MTPTEKQQAHKLLTRRYAEQHEQVASIEPRLADYFDGLCAHPEWHNGNELLGAVKFLRLLRTYVLDIETVRDIVFKYEGIWEPRNGIWQHVEGGIKHPGTTGPTYYRLQPFQVFILVAMFGLRAWIDTETEAGTRALLPTEQERNGRIYDLRRLCTEFTDFTPRKTAKTQIAAFIGFLFFFASSEGDGFIDFGGQIDFDGFFIEAIHSDGPCFLIVSVGTFFGIIRRRTSEGTIRVINSCACRFRCDLYVDFVAQKFFISLDILFNSQAESFCGCANDLVIIGIEFGFVFGGSGCF